MGAYVHQKLCQMFTAGLTRNRLKPGHDTIHQQENGQQKGTNHSYANNMDTSHRYPVL